MQKGGISDADLDSCMAVAIWSCGTRRPPSDARQMRRYVCNHDFDIFHTFTVMSLQICECNLVRDDAILQCRRDVVLIDAWSFGFMGVSLVVSSLQSGSAITEAAYGFVP